MHQIVIMSNDKVTVHGHHECLCTDDAQSLNCPITPFWCNCPYFCLSENGMLCASCLEISLSQSDIQQNAEDQEDNEKDEISSNSTFCSEIENGSSPSLLDEADFSNE